MAITSTLTTSFKKELLEAKHNFLASGGNSFKLALYTSSATMGATTTAYSTSQEASGTNYTAGGNALTNNGVAIASNIAYVAFADLTFSSVTLTAVGALIYKSGGSNNAVLVLDFGGTKTATNGDFVIQFPAADSSSAIIRLGNA